MLTSLMSIPILVFNFGFPSPAQINALVADNQPALFKRGFQEYVIPLSELVPRLSERPITIATTPNGYDIVLIIMRVKQTQSTMEYSQLRMK